MANESTSRAGLTGSPTQAVLPWALIGCASPCKPIAAGTSLWDVTPSLVANRWSERWFGKRDAYRPAASRAGSPGPAVLLAAVVALAGLQTQPSCMADEVSPVRAYLYFVHWVSVGRDDLASGQFSDDAVVIAGPDCTSLAPCVGKAAIRDRYIRSLRAGRTPLPLLDQRFNGESLRTHGESLPQQGPRGVVRVRGGHVFEFRNGLIQSLRVELDASDPATAAFIEGRKAAMPLAGH